MICCQHLSCNWVRYLKCICKSSQRNLIVAWFNLATSQILIKAESSITSTPRKPHEKQKTYGEFSRLAHNWPYTRSSFLFFFSQVSMCKSTFWPSWDSSAAEHGRTMWVSLWKSADGIPCKQPPNLHTFMCWCIHMYEYHMCTYLFIYIYICIYIYVMCICIAHNNRMHVHLHAHIQTVLHLFTHIALCINMALYVLFIIIV